MMYKVKQLKMSVNYYESNFSDGPGFYEKYNNYAARFGINGYIVYKTKEMWD